jgi:hypothetical protein
MMVAPFFDISSNISKILGAGGRSVAKDTLPEIQTLLDGVTVGGHKVSDQEIALNQAAA